MAPEQARGKPVDKRADIWAFGVVLYEMLTGRRAFPGANGTEVLAAVLRDTPDLTALPADTPSSVRHLLARCLERDPSRRLRDIGEARIALEERAGSEPSVPVGTTREASSRRSRLSAFPRARGAGRLALWSLAAVAAASVTLAAWAVFGRGNDRRHEHAGGAALRRRLSARHRAISPRRRAASPCRQTARSSP